MDRYSERKSNKPIFITVVLTAVAIFVLHHLFFKGPEVVQVQEVCGHGQWAITKSLEASDRRWSCSKAARQSLAK